MFRARGRGLGLAIAAVCLLVAGCSRPEGVLVPFEGQIAGTDVVDLLVATTRLPDTEDPGLLFSGERGEMAYAEISVSIPPAGARKEGEIQWPAQLPPNPATDFVTVAAQRVDEAAANRFFDRQLAQSRDRHVLVFIHGYNNRFESAVYRLAQIVHDSRAPVVPVLFTWPSRGKLLAYTYDRESANYSRDALERLLTDLSRNPRVRTISILSHSMGNWVTLEALRQMAIRNGRILPKIKDVMMAAPDVDVDVFQTQVSAFGPKRPNFILFASRRDKALAVSRRVWGGQRLGAIDPKVEPYSRQLERAGVVPIDLSKDEAAGGVGHDVFAQSPEAIRLIGRQLEAGQDLNTYNVGLGEKIGELATATGANIGAAAGLIVTAPLAVVDPQTRGSYDERVEHLGQSITDTLDNATDLPAGASRPPFDDRR